MTKFYVVSEAELQKLYECAYADGSWNQFMGIDEANPEYSENTNITETACRAREVEPIGGGMYQLTDWDFQGNLKDE